MPGLKLSGDLLHLRARVYHPRLKRFLSADVIDLYRYTYTLGDPVNLVDPSGLEAKSPQQEQQCEWDGAVCKYPEVTVRTGWRGPADLSDPFDRDRYGPEDWDASERDDGDPTGGDRGTTGGERGGTTGSRPARQNVPGDWSDYWIRSATGSSPH